MWYQLRRFPSYFSPHTPVLKKTVPSLLKTDFVLQDKNENDFIRVSSGPECDYTSRKQTVGHPLKTVITTVSEMWCQCVSEVHQISIARSRISANPHSQSHVYNVHAQLLLSVICLHLFWYANYETYMEAVGVMKLHHGNGHDYSLCTMSAEK